MDGELEVATVRVGTAAFNCRAKVLETLPVLAVSIAAWAAATEDTVAVNPALLAFAGTVTAAGNVTIGLLLDKLTLSPVAGAVPVKVTRQESVAAPVMDALSQDTALNADCEPFAEYVESTCCTTPL